MLLTDRTKFYFSNGYLESIYLESIGLNHICCIFFKVLISNGDIATSRLIIQWLRFLKYKAYAKFLCRKYIKKLAIYILEGVTPSLTLIYRRERSKR